jgi:hypothetical protein
LLSIRGQRKSNRHQGDKGRLSGSLFHRFAFVTASNINASYEINHPPVVIDLRQFRAKLVETHVACPAMCASLATGIRHVPRYGMDAPDRRRALVLVIALLIKYTFLR